MLVLLALTILLVLICCVLGQGVLTVCGWERWRWWAPIVGVAVLLIVDGQVVRLPGRATTGAIVTVILVLVALILPGVRRGLAEAAPEGVPLALFVLLLAAIPFFAYGHAGTLGVTSPTT